MKNWFLTSLIIYILALNSIIQLNAAQANDYVLDTDDILNADIEDLLGSNALVTIASGRPIPGILAPGVTYVITSNEIKRMGATDIDQALETVPGLHVSYNNLQAPIYVFRGIYSNRNPHVLVMINGVPITNLFDENRGNVWGGMPVENVGRIEIMRGPNSAMYGADAVSGIINVITKTAKEIDGVQTGIRYGSYQTKEAWLLYGKEYEKVNVTASLQVHDTDGFKGVVESDAQTVLDGIFGTQASLAPSTTNLSRENWDARLDIGNDEWQWQMGYQRRDNWGNNFGVAQALDPHNRYLSQRFNTNINWLKDVGESWQLDTQVAFYWNTQEIIDDLILLPPGTNIGFGVMPDGLIGNPEYKERHTRFNLKADYWGWKNHGITLGMGYHFGDMYETKATLNFGIDPNTGLPIPVGSPLIDTTDTPQIYLAEGSRTVWYLLAQDIWEVGHGWELTTGIRYDDYSDFGGAWNPRIALVKEIDTQWSSKILYGEAFRAPSFNEQFLINNPVLLGNPNIQPETMKNIDWSLDYHPGHNFNANLGLYYYRLSELIEYIPDNNGDTITAQNTGEQTGYGLEWEVRYNPMKTLKLVANYAYQVSTNKSVNEDAGNDPSHQLYGRMDWDFNPRWQWDLQARYLWGRKRQPNDPRQEIDNNLIVDTTLRYQLNKHFSIAGSVRNLFDEDVREPSAGPDSNGIINIQNDLPQSERNGYIELRYQF